mmetsp:Transcript_42102/g.135770  ORF Transcript_42102/g.135770 Transcript_42102/m.135770 type:complete len:223 (+) Transcript_42102:558-1226(+)
MCSAKQRGWWGKSLPPPLPLSRSGDTYTARSPGTTEAARQSSHSPQTPQPTPPRGTAWTMRPSRSLALCWSQYAQSRRRATQKRHKSAMVGLPRAGAVPSQTRVAPGARGTVGGALPAPRCPAGAAGCAADAADSVGRAGGAVGCAAGGALATCAVGVVELSAPSSVAWYATSFGMEPVARKAAIFSKDALPTFASFFSPEILTVSAVTAKAQAANACAALR